MLDIHKRVFVSTAIVVKVLDEDSHGVDTKTELVRLTGMFISSDVRKWL